MDEQARCDIGTLLAILEFNQNCGRITLPVAEQKVVAGVKERWMAAGGEPTK